jgi:hypothetical protein
MIFLFFTLKFWLLEQKPKVTKNIRDYLIKNQNQSNLKKNLKSESKFEPNFPYFENQN